ncbi:MAG: PilZ domain-containing protein [Deltaproteobacteria bacterium]|nr:PilZ domain-containing protein [Myxococcales bacterium]MDP3213961.1 PilZ domain-containing protein [Deltaproteobacteria bacterium]
MSNRYLDPAFDSDIGPVGGPAELEVNAVLTTSGHVTLAGGHITYEPGLDARLLGRGPLVIAVAEVTAVSCRDGHRRVVLHLGAQELVLRGVGAQRVWVALTVLRDERPGAMRQAPLLFEEEPGGHDDRNGLYGIGAQGYGYAGRLPVGLVISFWEELSALRSIRAEGELVVRGAEARSIHGAGAATFVAALIDRWLEVAATGAIDDGWQPRVAWYDEGEVLLGALTIDAEGVVFTPVEGAARVLAARGGRSVARVRPADGRGLDLEDERRSYHLRTLDAAGLVASLTSVFVSAGWRAGASALAHRALPDEQITLLYGLCSSATITHQAVPVAHAGRQLLKPNAYEVELDVIADPAALPLAPFPCDLQVANPRGLYSVQGVAASFTARPRRAGVDPTQGAALVALVRFRAEVVATNRRDYFRLAVDVVLHRVELVVGGAQMAITRGARMVNVSRRGCRVALPVAPDPGTPCTLVVGFDEHPTAVSGRIVNVSVVDAFTWHVGIAYTAESYEPGARVFQERQTAFLRKRHGA